MSYADAQESQEDEKRSRIHDSLAHELWNNTYNAPARLQRILYIGVKYTRTDGWEYVNHRAERHRTSVQIIIDDKCH